MAIIIVGTSILGNKGRGKKGQYNSDKKRLNWWNLPFGGNLGVFGLGKEIKENLK